MICGTGRIHTPLDKDAYAACMSDLHRAERNGRKVDCPTCDQPLAMGSLRSQLVSQHDQYILVFFGAGGEGEEGAGTPTLLGG